MSDGTIRVGIGGWSFPPWRGTFFPQGLPQSRELGHAARAFGAIEINGTFYSRQARSTWENWGAAVPDGLLVSGVIAVPDLSMPVIWIGLAACLAMLPTPPASAGSGSSGATGELLARTPGQEPALESAEIVK